MRKKSREMDARFALQVIDEAPYVTLSMIRTDGIPYGIPISVARTDDKTIYFHCALKGEKVDSIIAQPQVCISAVSRCIPTVGPKDNSFTLEYKSAVAYGKATIVDNDEEKINALRAICLRFLPGHMDAFDAAIERSLKATMVIRIDLTEPPTGKRKQYDKNGDEMKYGRME